MQAPGPTAALESARIVLDTDTESSESQPLLESDDDDFQEGVSVRRSSQ